jgi:hypothetical protein
MQATKRQSIRGERALCLDRTAVEERTDERAEIATEVLEDENAELR